MLFDSIRLILVEKELLGFADPFLFLDLDVVSHLLGSDGAIDIVHQYRVCKLSLETFLKAEVVVVFLEESDQLKAVHQRVIFHSRGTHDLIAEALLTGITAA